MLFSVLMKFNLTHEEAKTLLEAGWVIGFVFKKVDNGRFYKDLEIHDGEGLINIKTGISIVLNDGKPMSWHQSLNKENEITWDNTMDAANRSYGSHSQFNSYRAWHSRPHLRGLIGSLKEVNQQQLIELQVGKGTK